MLKVYRVPVAGQISKNFSLVQILGIVANFKPEEYRVDINGRATIAGNVGKDIVYKDVPLTKFIDKL